MALIIGTEPDMEAQATDRMVEGLVRRLERDGHRLTPKMIERIHGMITECTPDERTITGTLTEASKAIRERIERDR